MRYNPVTGFESFTCPHCGAFLNIQPYIDLKTDNVCCRKCQQFVNVPALISLETDPKPFHPAQLRRNVKLMPNGKNKVSKYTNTYSHKQLDLFSSNPPVDSPLSCSCDSVAGKFVCHSH